MPKFRIPVPTADVQARVLELFAKYGHMDDYELIDRYRFDHDASVAESTPRTRRRELVDAGQLRQIPNAINRNRTNGRELRVWGLA